MADKFPSLIVVIPDAGRATDHLALRKAEEFFHAPVAALNFAISQQGDSHDSGIKNAMQFAQGLV